MKTKELDKLSNKDIILKYGVYLIKGIIDRKQYDRIVAYCQKRVEKNILKEVVDVFD